MILPVALALIALVAVLGAHRAISARRIERQVGARLAIGPDGIIVGARAIDRPRDENRSETRAEPDRAALLLHGFGDTPQTLAHVADALYARGYAVRVPLLPGHGRALHEFARSNADQWLGAARAEYAAMRAAHSSVALVGLSMGGALAAILATESDDLPALVLLAPYLDAPTTVRRAGRMHRLLDLVAPYVGGRSEHSIHDPRAAAESLAYRVAPARLLGELVRLADRARASLPRVMAPTLIVQSREDNRIEPRVAVAALAAVGARDKQLVWIEGSGHVLTVDFGWERVTAAVCDWLDAHRARAESSTSASGQVA